MSVRIKQSVGEERQPVTEVAGGPGYFGLDWTDVQLFEGLENTRLHFLGNLNAKKRRH
jgi:hypothetical protein